MSFKLKLSNHALVYKLIGGGFCIFTISNVYHGSERFYDNVIMPIVHLFGADCAHSLAIFANKHRLLPKSHYRDPETLHTSLLNLTFSNPLGVASGVDKQGESVMGLMDVGFSFVEVGSVSPQLQSIDLLSDINDLHDDRIVERYGFDNKEHDEVLQRIQTLRSIDNFSGVIGVNLDCNVGSSGDPILHFVMGVQKFGCVADYLVIDLTRSQLLLSRKKLPELIYKVIKARNSINMKTKPLVLVKVSPNLTPAERRFVASVINMRNCRIDGIIIPTTVDAAAGSIVGSSIPTNIRGLATAMEPDSSCTSIADMYKLTEGKMPIIVDGGVFTGKDAYEKIKAGASLIQLYSPFINHGPPRVTRIKKDLDKLLKGDGFRNVTEAVGTATRCKQKNYFFPFY